MKNTAFALPLLLVGAACAPAHAGGAPVSEARDVAGFTKVDASGAFDIHIRRGDACSVVVEASPGDLEHVRTERHGDTLALSWEGLRLFGGGKIRVQVTLPELERLETSGATVVRAEGLAGERLDVQASGASHLVLAGTITEVRYDLSGATKLDALALDAEAVRIDASGATKAKVRATRSLTAEASGASRIRYAGKPEAVQSDLSGAGSLKRI